MQNSLNANERTMYEFGYVIAPNNIWGLPGVRMYASAPGILELPNRRNEVWVTASDVVVYSPAGKEVDRFAGAAEFLAHLRAVGVPAEPGLPAFANSWD